jgi:hypothetical protein
MSTLVIVTLAISAASYQAPTATAFEPEICDNGEGYVKVWDLSPGGSGTPGNRYAYLCPDVHGDLGNPIADHHWEDGSGDLLDNSISAIDLNHTPTCTIRIRGFEYTGVGNQQWNNYVEGFHTFTSDHMANGLPTHNLFNWKNKITSAVVWCQQQGWPSNGGAQWPHS